MKDALFQLKNYYFPNKGGAKETQLNLPSILSRKSEISSYKPADKVKNMKKPEDPLIVRIKKNNDLNINLIDEYFNNTSFLQKLNISFNNFLIKNKLVSEKRFWSLKRINSKFYSTPNYADHFNKHFFFSKRTTLLMLVLLSYTIGYIFSRSTNDVYFRRYGYSFFPTIMTYVDNVDYKLTQLDSFLEYYFPREFTEREYEYLIYNKLMYWNTRRKFDSKLKKIDFIDKDILEIDLILQKMHS